MSNKLADALKHFSEKLRITIEGGNEIAIVTHLDADGIASGSIMAIALRRMGARYSVRAVSDMNSSVLNNMKAEGHDFYAITDLGGGWTSHLKKVLGNKWIIIDHHQISEEEILTDDEGQILNPWKYGIDGGREVPAGGMAYMVANALDAKNHDLSAIAVVSAVADRQDQGDKKSFIGLNAEILKTARSLGLVNVDLDIMLTGRESRPLHEALAYTSFPYIEGLTWNREACYQLLSNAGLKLRANGGRWRAPAEFSQEEKSTILGAISKFVAGSNKEISDMPLVVDLLGYVYTLTKEDKWSQLRDAREFATMLNACGRVGRAGVGVAICMGDRNSALSSGEQIVNTYIASLRSYICRIFTEKWRLVDDGKVTFVNGEGLLDENMLGAVSSLLSGSPSFIGRLLFVRTLTKDGSAYRFSSRKCLNCKSEANLGVVMRSCSQALDGSGGGHSAAAGCRIPYSTLERFVTSIKAAINDPKFIKS
ncbi:MAG: DHH family phosphoesterase [Thermoproteota archaeon]|nr:DHH family phosphoesterase [Thermoproteota archaeon]